MKATPLGSAGVLLIEPSVFGDARGFFQETWNAPVYRELGIEQEVVQSNLSKSQKGVLRGLHFQEPFPQGKLVMCPLGAVFDVAVDIRVGSPTFGQWWGAELTEENHHQLWVPPGFAHGFEVLCDTALFSYFCTDRYHPETEGCVLWNDPEIGIPWRTAEPSLSAKDQAGILLRDFPPGRLPVY